MHALGQLIDDCRKADPSLTYARIAELSGEAFAASAVGKWANKRAKKLDALPHPDSILGLARALNVTPWRVLAASAQAAGLDVGNPEHSSFAADLPPNIDVLPKEVQHYLKRLIWAIANPTKQKPASGNNPLQ